MFGLKLSKRNRSLVIGVASGLLCALSVGVYVMEVDREAEAAQSEMLARYGGEQIDVCVAKRDIVAGETISESDVETRTWVAALLPANAVTDSKEAVGEQVGSTILAGEVISTSRFGFDAASLDVPEGLVAVSVPSRDVQSVGGAVTAGSVVDVYAVGASSTSCLARSVRVLATSMESESSGSGAAAWVTLAVAPDRVQELVSAAQTLELYFALPSDSVASDPSVGSPQDSDDMTGGDR